MPDSLPATDLAALAGLILQGDSTAERLLVEHFTPRVRAMALARLRNADAAQDVTQETLIAVLQAARRGQIRDQARLPAFVLGVARNLINNYVRGRREHLEVDLDEEALGLHVEIDHSARERRTLLARALETLGAPDRQVLLLTLVEGLKPAEIAARLGTTSEVVRTRKTRALKRVLEAIAGLSRPAALVPHSSGERMDGNEL